MDLDAVIEFVKTVEAFKTCERDCRTTAGSRAESDAEHSWHLALFLMLLEKEFTDVDVHRIMKMALIHDLPEIYAGDTNPYRGDTAYKEEKEKKAAVKLFSGLPAAASEDLHALFDEYMAQQTAEARIVKAADKLMPLLQNLCTNARFSSYRKMGVTYEEVRAYMDPFFDGGVLHAFYRKLLGQAHAAGVFSAPAPE